MMLTIQIAAGIVLASVIIVNHRVVMKFAGSLLVLGLIIIAVVLISWAASSAYTSVSPQLSRILGKLGMMAGAVAMLCCIAAGGFGLLWAVHETFKRPRVYLTKATLGIAVLANCALVIGAGYLSVFTPIGAWIDGADRWSRANGHADGASVMIFALSCLWPFGVVLMLRLIRGRFIVTQWPGRDQDAPNAESVR